MDFFSLVEAKKYVDEKVDVKIVDFTSAPGRKYLDAGDIEDGFFGFVQPTEFGEIAEGSEGYKTFNGSNLAKAIGLSQGTLINSDTPWMKFSYNNKILFVPVKPIRCSAPWDAIYNTGSVYGTEDEGLLPPTGRLGTDLSIDDSDNSINATTQRFLGDKTESMDYADTVGTAGDILVLKGWATPGNNGECVIDSITNTKIIVTGLTLATEAGGKSSRIYNKTKAVTQNRKITVGNSVQCRVRLLKGAGSDPLDSYADTDRGAIGAGNEWNDLILPMHEHAKAGNWTYPDYAKNSEGGAIEDWNIGLTDKDLIAHYNYGSGSYSWCQETHDTTSWRRANRGGGGASDFTAGHSWNTATAGGLRPVLEVL